MNAVGRVRTATETIEQHFAVADEILDRQLDKLVRQFKQEHADFVSRYRSARLIVNVAASRANGPAAPAGKPATVPMPAAVPVPA